jgi:nucleoside-diphosphate-sugar epimerase
VAETGLTVAVTGPTGTFGFGLMPLLQSDRRVKRIVGIARRPFDPEEHGWTKMEYRQGDVRDQGVLEAAFAGVDVVVHLAFLITGNASRDTIRAINIEGTMNTFRAAANAGAKRFVYASSVAAYGFHRDNPVGMTEEWPARPAKKLFYAQEKAEIERLLNRENEIFSDIDLYLLRPPIVLGPHTIGGKDVPFAGAGKWFDNLLQRLPFGLPAPVPDMPLQFIHEDDVGKAFLQCIVAAGPPGVYNITADDVLSVADVAREFGVAPLPIPGGVIRPVARVLSSLPTPPFAPPSVEWLESASHPAIMDATKAREELGWQPEFSSIAALRDTIRHMRSSR